MNKELNFCEILRSTEKQVGACCFDKVGVVVGAGNEWETREETSTIPVIRVDER